MDGLTPDQYKALEQAFSYVAKAPFERIGAIIDARLSYWHFTNLLAVAEKVQKKLAEKGIDPAGLDPKFREIVPILEASKNEDDDTLQNMWASLLVASLEERGDSPALNYQRILSLLSPLEVGILQCLEASIKSVRLDDPGPVFDTNVFHQIQITALSECLNSSTQGIELAVQHLNHLGLVTAPIARFTQSSKYGPAREDIIHFTIVGLDFTRRCMGLGVGNDA